MRLVRCAGTRMGTLTVAWNFCPFADSSEFLLAQKSNAKPISQVESNISPRCFPQL